MICGIPQTAGVRPGTYPVCVVQGKSHFADWKPLSDATAIFWWHASLRTLMSTSCCGYAVVSSVGLHLWCRGLVKIKPAAILRRQDPVLWCSTTRRQHRLPTTAVKWWSTMRGCCSFDGARDLGLHVVTLDCSSTVTDLILQSHVQLTVSRCFDVLRQLRQIRRSVSTASFLALVVALVHSRLDYCNSVMVVLPVYLTRSLSWMRRSTFCSMLAEWRLCRPVTSNTHTK